ncbi:MAG: hypothetical protein LBH00_12485 [Planctomycetaceae bacterium]|jgi:hypothetical protein|nr:hypothetical protein [Planctomycetaceae bacterium]
MINTLSEAIDAVRGRQHEHHFFRCIAWGNLTAAVLFPLTLFPQISLPAWFVILIALSAPLIYGFFCRTNRLSAAAVIDRHYGLKDRMLTAAVLQQKSALTPTEQLQIADAEQHLAAFQLNDVLPQRFPRICDIALWMMLFSFAGTRYADNYLQSRWQAHTEIMETVPAENPVLREEIVTKTEELVKENPEEKTIAGLAEQMQTLTGKFEQSANDPKESLAALSEMEEKLQTAQESLQLEVIDELLQKIAAALEITEKTLPVSRALQKQDFTKAAAELKKLDAATLQNLSKPEKKAIAEKMEAAAENAGEKNHKTLQKAAEKMSEALTEGDGAKAEQAAKELANEAEKQGVRQGIGKSLENKRMMIGMMKADQTPGSMSGGKQTNKTKQASSHWGQGAAGNPNTGQQTNLAGKRRQEKLTGQMTENGETEKTTLNSDEVSVTKSNRQYQERYQQYRKTAETVLESEPIPLGQRQTIRRYFEAIRPASPETAD